MKFLVLSALAFSFSACAYAATAPAAYPKIVDETALKESVNPCDDFYQFSCGTWLDKTVIPDDKKSVYRQSTPMSDSVDERLNKILESYANGKFEIPATYATKLADFYKSCMTADAHADESLQLLKTKIENIKKTQSAEQIANLAAGFQKAGTGLFNFYAMQDYNDSTVVLADISQGGMALTNPAYYLDQDAKSVEIRETYKKYVAEVFVLLGAKPTDAQVISVTILRLETALASKAYSVTDQSDPDKVNHVMDLVGLKKLAPDFNWVVYLKAMGITTSRFNVDEPEFFQNFNTVLKAMTPVEKTYYFTWLLADHSVDKMGGAFELAHFNFWKKYMNGAKSMSPRWKICTQSVEESLGYALSEAYVKTFDGDAIKVKTNSMIDEIKDTFVQDLNILSTGADAWIDGQTVKEAIVKAQAIVRKVGAPQVFRNYSSLVVKPTNYLENALSISAFESKRDVAKIGKPVDKTEWGMMPWEVNAYYDRSNNEFVFPFGILQPPSLDLMASDGANFGAFGGGTIGHELTHGFDSAGSKYDSHGNLKDWWTEETKALFGQKAQCYVDQANLYKIKSVDLFVNGAQTLEENLADQGGVKLGYMALEQILKTRPQATPWMGKYTERQQYWIAYAQSWCGKSTVESLRSQMTNDVHPPAEFRVNEVMMNRPEFAADFKCAAGQPMAPVNRCSLW
ncbi:MAG: M13 family metallopeptidase [Bdellovibrio sp.]|nr:M13 family metallopeptidase [Bdellovibrio sp.]